MVSEELGRPILLDTHPKYAVALGAATLTTQPVPPPATKPATKMATELVTGASGARRPRSIRSTLLVIAAALLLGGLATLGWTLSTLRGTLQANSSVAAAPVLPAVLPPPRHVPIPIETAQTTHLTKAGPFLLALNGARISELEADTLAPRWTLDLPKPGRFLHTLSDELVCVKTSPTECIPVNWVARTVGPALQLPGEVYVLLSFGSGKSVVMLDQTGTLSVMDIQTRSVRSVPVPGWSRTSGRTLLGVGEHRMYVVANDEAPAPVLMIVDLDIVAVVASMPWPRANTMTSPKATEYMQVSPDGGSLYTVGGQDLLIYETATMTLQRKAPQQTALKATMALSPDGRYLFLLTVDGELRVIEAATGLQVSSGRTTADARSVIDLDRGRKVAVYNNTTPRGYDLFDTSAFAAS
jgi:hypothetical protein